MTTWQIFAIASSFFAALTAIFGKIAVAEVNSNLATFIRTVIILILIACVLSFKKEWQGLETLSKKSLVFLILSGIATGLSWLCYYRALQLGPASKVAPIDKMSVAIVVILSAIFLGESLTWKTVAGTALVIAGAVLTML